MSRRRWWEHTSEEIYAYRTRRPSGRGTHWGYVGRTAWPARRHQEHTVGGGKWRATAKPWADLVVERRVMFRKKRRLEITTHFLEWSMIKLLMPVYNIQMNWKNPRRIPPWVAQRQRLQRSGAASGGPLARRGVPLVLQAWMVLSGALVLALVVARGQ